MVTKDKYSLDPSLAAMYAGRKLITEAWGNWAKQIGKLIRGREEA